ncbi:MAG: POTRA domain-containing protein [Methylococcales bacterium]|nr:POTRA domain-containing protein [Methylococcales bacterium]
MRARLIPAVILGFLNAACLAADQPQPAVNEEARPVFDILDMQIDGNTVLDDETLERAVYPFLGPDKTVDDVEKARGALEAAYRNAGYPTVVVAIPEQDVNAGNVRLDVVEGRIETLHITGSRYYSLGKIREALPGLAEGQVPHMPSVQAQMTTLAREASDRNVTPVFRAGSTPGQMEVEVKVKDALPVHGSVEMNSRNTSDTSYSRLIGTLRYDNLWQLYHSASIQYQVSPQDPAQVGVVTGTYVMPTGWYDTRLAVYGMSISSNTLVPGVQVGDLSVIGNGSVFGLRLVKPVQDANGGLQSFTWGFDYKSFGTTTTSKTDVDYLKFIAGYDTSWRTAIAVTTLNLVGNFSFRGLGNNAAQFAAKRVNAQGVGASPDFMYLAGTLKNQLLLPWDFQLHSRVMGQASSTYLINNEQFSAGGPLSVRGYHQSQVLADNGLNLSMELHSPRLFASDWESVQNFRALAFAEWAGLWSSNLPPTPSNAYLASAGMGLRMKVFKSLSGEFDWSYPLRAYNSLTGNVGVGQQRVDFRMLYEF